MARKPPLPKPKPKPKVKPESRGALTKERVLRAALQLADAEGVAALSMRKLADQLRVEAMSLYHHVANKDEILDGMVDLVFGEIVTPPAGADWKSAMRERACSARAALMRHPWAVGRMDSRRNPGPLNMRHHESVIGCLRRAGFSVAMTAHAYALLDSYIYGFVLQELSLPFASSAELEDVAEALLAQLPADQFPHLTELAVEHAMKPGYAFSDEFAFGLELVLDGLAQRLAAASHC